MTTPKNNAHPKMFATPKRSMQIKFSSLRLAAATAAFAALPFSLTAQTWTGSSNTSWGNAGNWNPGSPAFDTTTDLLFDTSAVTNPATHLFTNRTARSITFGADVDGPMSIRLTEFIGNEVGRNLTLQAASGNASLNVNAGSTGAIDVGASVGGGSIILGSSLDIAHAGSGVLLFSRPTTGNANNITKTGSGAWQVNNNISGPGAINLDGGTMIANTFGVGDLNFATAVNLRGGTLEIGSRGSDKDYTTPPVNVTSASALTFNNTSATTNYQLTFSGSGAFDLGANLTARNISTNTANVNQFNINRAITGSGNMIVETYNNIASVTDSFVLGRVNLAGDNSGWSGNLVVRQGTAQFGGVTASSSAGAGDIIIGETANAFGAGVQFAPFAATGNQTVSRDIIVRSGGFRQIRFAGDNTHVLDGTMTLEGDLMITNANFFNTHNIIINGDISGDGGITFNESGSLPGSAFTRLTGTNTYTGATNIGTDATLDIFSASGNAIGNSSAVTFEAGSTLQFNSTNETVGSIASSGTDGTINLGANTLTTGGNGQTTSFGGVISGAGGNLTKVGLGTMTLTGASDFTGTTTVGAGTLALGAAATLASESILIETAGTLNVTAGGLTIASGNRIGGDGSVVGNLTLADGAEFVLSLLTTLEVAGTVNLNDTFSVASLVNADGSAIDWTLVGNDTYTLINSTLTTDFSNISNFGSADPFNIGNGRIAYFENGSLALVVIPEPSTAVLLIGSVGLFALLRRRFRNG